MNKRIATAALLIGCFMLTGCGKVIEPGWTGIKINQLGSGKGVSKENIVTGLTLYMPGMSRIVKYPTSNQRVVWTHSAAEGSPSNEELTFNTRDQIRVDMDASLNYTLNPAKVPEFYVQYRADRIEQFTHGFLRDAARNAVTRIGGEYTFEQLNGEKKEEFLNRIEKAINDVVAPNGVEVRQFSSIGALRPPEEITRAVIRKTESIQNAITAENQLRQVTAEANKKVAEAEGASRANRALTASITPTLVEWKKLELREKEIAKWKGDVPSVVTGTGSGLLLNINK